MQNHGKIILISSGENEAHEQDQKLRLWCFSAKMAANSDDLNAVSDTSISLDAKQEIQNFRLARAAALSLQTSPCYVLLFADQVKCR